MTVKSSISPKAPAAGVLMLCLVAGPLGAQTPGPAALPPQLQACLDSPATATPEAALALCQAALSAAADDSDRALSHFGIAHAARAAGRYDQAMAAADHAAGLLPAPETLGLQASLRLLVNRHDEALAIAEAGLGQFPRDTGLQRTRLLSLSALGRGGEVIPDLERLHRAQPEDHEVTVALVGALQGVGQTRRGDQILERAISRSPEAPDLRLVRAVIELPNRPAQAVGDLDVVIAQAPTPNAYALRGFARLATGDVEGARQDMAAIPDPATLNATALIYASSAAEALGDQAGALIFAEQLVASVSPADLPFSLTRRGDLRLAKGDRDLAKADFERAALLDPEEASAWAGLGALTLQTDPAEALVFYRRAHSLAPDDSGYEFGLAEALYWTGDYANAAAAFANLVKRFPDDAELHASLAASLRELDQVEAAETPSRRAVELAPDEPSYRAIHSEVLFILGDLEGALEQLDRLPADAHSANTRYMATFIHRVQENYEAALREADAGLALDPEDADLMEEKGGVYYMLDDPLSAREWLDKALTINSRRASTLYLRGMVRAELGDADGAAADQAAAIAIDPALARDP